MSSLAKKFIVAAILVSVSSAAFAYKVTSQKDATDWRNNKITNIQVMCDNGKSKLVIKQHGMVGTWVYTPSDMGGQYKTLDEAAKETCKE